MQRPIDGTATVLAAENISKSFGGAAALRNVSVQFQPGEVVALVGENGAGKSTLLKVLAAVIERDGGTASIDGHPYAPQNQRQAERAGVALVFQEQNVSHALTIAENIMLGRLRDFRGFGLIDWTELNRTAQEILERMGAEFSVHDDIALLDLGQLKTIEVARALALAPRFIFFDESTAFLNHVEATRLMAVIAELRRQGIGIGFVSHHLQEVFEIADTIVVLKDGALVGAYPVAEMNEARLYELMVGRDMVGGLFPRRARMAPGADVLVVQDVATSDGGSISLALQPGAVVGVGGLKGSGGEAIIAALAGSDRVRSGSMLHSGKAHAPRQPRDAWRAGIATLPGDRTGEGVIAAFSVLENLTLATRPRRAGWIVDRPAMRQTASDQVAALAIKTQSLDTPVGSLSGGNMQKVALGKCLAAGPRILLLN
ncbi:MAG: sugar ABC transporter ATP-binding protein, partial [Pseudorhodobacter sp.]|nr:sugar ABC transporter ATP-binding protein [Pseudorhodobacter sp.]